MTSRKKIGTTPEGTPWSVKGVSPETREAVKKAARRANKTIGDWVDEALRLAATESLKTQLPAKRLEDQLEEISGKLDELRRPWWQRLFGGASGKG